MHQLERLVFWSFRLRSKQCYYSLNSKTVFGYCKYYSFSAITFFLSSFHFSMQNKLINHFYRYGTGPYDAYVKAGYPSGPFHAIVWIQTFVLCFWIPMALIQNRYIFVVHCGQSIFSFDSIVYWLMFSNYLKIMMKFMIV